MVDYKCKLDCPIIVSPPFCCRACIVARAGFVTDENKHLWDSKYGFWSKEGCKLSRDKMPQECKEFDCHKFRWCITMKWEGKWVACMAAPIATDSDVFVFKRKFMKIK